MKRPLLVLLLTLISVGVSWATPEITVMPWPPNHLEEFRKQPKADLFKSLIKSKISNEKLAEQVALKHLFKKHGLLAEEGLSVTALRKGSRRTKGQWLWQITLTEFAVNWSGIIIVNANSGEAYSLIPSSPKNNEKVEQGSAHQSTTRSESKPE